jgi:dihydrofolate reductase
MGKVILDMSTSLDGFIAKPNGETGPLHSWLLVGKTTSRYDNMFKTSGRSMDVLDEMFNSTGAMVAGRRTYDLAKERIGRFPIQVPIFILTHHIPDITASEATNFTFVTDGIESAIEQASASAGDKNVVVIGGANVAQQCIASRLLHETQIHMVPILLKEGILLFENLNREEVKFDTSRVIEAPGVIHLKFRMIY